MPDLLKLLDGKNPKDMMKVLTLGKFHKKRKNKVLKTREKVRIKVV